MSVDTDATTPVAPAQDSAPVEAGPTLASRWRSVCSACRQVFGFPDYERYLAHAAANHPDKPVLSRDDYCRLAIDRRYGGGGGKGGMRCC